MITSLKQHVSSILSQAESRGRVNEIGLVVVEQDETVLKQTYLQSAPLFSELNEDEREAIGQRMLPETYGNDEYLFLEGQHGDALYLIGNGWVDISTEDEAGGRPSRGPGSLIGEVDFLLGRPRSQTARVSGEVLAWKLDNDALSELIAEQPAIGLKLGLVLGTGIVQLRNVLAERLAEVPLLNELSEEERRAIAGCMSPQRCLPRETIFRSGSPPAGIFFIEQGSIWLFGESDDDYAEISAGNIIGQEEIVCRTPHSRTAQAASEVVIWQLSPADFAALAHEYPYIRASLSRNIQHQLTEALTIALLIVEREIDELNIVAGDQSALVKKLHHVSQMLAWLKNHQELF